MKEFVDVSPLNIVLAEDDPHIGFMNQRALEMDGHHVEVARDGIEALEAVREKDPDLLILDLEMPRRGGFEVLEELRSDPDTVDQPVVVLSNSDLTDKEERRLSRLGVIEFLAKWKIPPRALADWIKRWAASHRRHQPRTEPD